MALEIKKSAIAGNGVFTGEALKKGCTIYILTGELCSIDEILRRVNEGKEAPADPLEVGQNELVALCDIPAGEEITYDYSTSMNDNEEHIISAGQPVWKSECNCKSKTCRGMIDQFKTLPRAAQQYYITNQYLPDFMLKELGG